MNPASAARWRGSYELVVFGPLACRTAPADAQAVQAVVDFLVSNAAQGVTDAVIAADGGFSITKASEPNPLLDARSP